ncbi:MAG: hypothetical protein ACKD6N_03440 [Candidatus Bathyarchaeota archaeon]
MGDGRRRSPYMRHVENVFVESFDVFDGLLYTVYTWKPSFTISVELNVRGDSS